MIHGQALVIQLENSIPIRANGHLGPIILPKPRLVETPKFQLRSSGHGIYLRSLAGGKNKNFNHLKNFTHPSTGNETRASCDILCSP